MTVATWLQPDFETQVGPSYKGPIDNCFAVAERFARAFAPHEASPADMTVVVDAGWVFAGGTLTEVAQQISAVIVAPAFQPRIDRIVYDAADGTIEVVAGVEDPDPDPPPIPGGTVPVCRVPLATDTTAITNQMIVDERALAGGGTFPGSPSELTIDTGAVTVTGGYHTIRNEGGAGTDELDTIDASALSEGELVMLAAGDAGEVPTLRSGVGNITLAGPNFSLDTAGKRIMLQKNAAGDLEELLRTPAQPPLLHVRDEKTSGTVGGNSAATTTQTRDLNTVVLNEIAGASLGSNQVTLPAGVYDVDARAPAQNVRRHRASLYSVTAAANLIVGTSEFSAASNADQTQSFVRDRIILAAETVVEVRHYTEDASSLGTSTNDGLIEVYTEMFIRRVG